MFVQSETQQNLLHRILFTTNLRVRYFFLDRQLRGFPKPFEVLHQCIRFHPWSDSVSFSKKLLRSLLYYVPGLLPSRKTILVLYAHSFMFYYRSWNRIQISQLEQEDALTEIVPPNNNCSAIYARYSNLIGILSVPLIVHSGSNFQNANNTVVRGGTFYAAHNLVVKQVQGEISPYLTPFRIINIRPRLRLNSTGYCRRCRCGMFRQRTPQLKKFSPITDPPSSSLLPGMSSRRKKFIKVEGIESILPIALPNQERSRSNCMKKAVLKM